MTSVYSTARYDVTTDTGTTVTRLSDRASIYFQPGDDEAIFLDELEQCNDGDPWSSIRKAERLIEDYF